MNKNDLLMYELDGYLSSVYDNDGIPDGAWFAMMEDETKRFIKSKNLNMDENDLVHSYLRWKDK